MRNLLLLLFFLLLVSIFNLLQWMFYPMINVIVTWGGLYVSDSRLKRFQFVHVADVVQLEPLQLDEIVQKNEFVQSFWGFYKLYIFENVIEPRVRKCMFPDFLTPYGCHIGFWKMRPSDDAFAISRLLDCLGALLISRISAIVSVLSHCSAAIEWMLQRYCCLIENSLFLRQTEVRWRNGTFDVDPERSFFSFSGSENH